MSFESECLAKHNELRALHGVPPLKANAELTKMCKDYAKVMVKTDNLKHSGDTVNGENIFFSMTTDKSKVLHGDRPVQDWYDEIKYYKFGVEPPQQNFKAGHFSQVIWKASTDLGVAMETKEGKFYVVCKYKPAGNFVNEFKDNVPAPLADVKKDSVQKKN